MDATTHPVDTANIQGNITSLSILGFSSDHQRNLTKLFNNKAAVSLQNCQIMEAREGQKIIIIKTSTQIDRSSKTLDLSDNSDDNPQTTITLAELVITRNFQRITVNVKVIKKSNATYVTGNKQKQNVTVSDDSSRDKLTQWESSIDTLALGASYTLQNIVAREYEGRMFLSMPREGVDIIPIPDIGPVDSESDSDSERQVLELFDVQITGVPQLDSYKACLSCKARVEPATPPLGRCSSVQCCNASTNARNRCPLRSCS